MASSKKNLFQQQVSQLLRDPPACYPVILPYTCPRTILISGHELTSEQLIQLQTWCRDAGFSSHSLKLSDEKSDANGTQILACRAKVVIINWQAVSRAIARNTLNTQPYLIRIELNAATTHPDWNTVYLPQEQFDYVPRLLQWTKRWCRNPGLHLLLPTPTHATAYQETSTRDWLQALVTASRLVAGSALCEYVMSFATHFGFQWIPISDQLFLFRYREPKPLQWNETALARNSLWFIEPSTNRVMLVSQAMPTQALYGASVSHDTYRETYYAHAMQQFTSRMDVPCVLSSKEDGCLLKVLMIHRSDPCFEAMIKHRQSVQQLVLDSVHDLCWAETKQEWTMGWHSNGVVYIQNQAFLDMMIQSACQVWKEPDLPAVVRRLVRLGLDLARTTQDPTRITLCFEVAGSEPRPELTVCLRQPLFRFLGYRALHGKDEVGSYIPHTAAPTQAVLRRHGVRDPLFWRFASVDQARTFAQIHLLKALMADNFDDLPRPNNWFDEHFHALEGFVVELQGIFFKLKYDMYLVAHTPHHQTEEALQRLGQLPDHIRAMLPVAETIHTIQNLDWTRILQHILSLYALYASGLVDEDRPTVRRGSKIIPIADGMPLLGYWLNHYFQWPAVVSELRLPPILAFMNTTPLLTQLRRVFFKHPHVMHVRLQNLFARASKAKKKA